MNFIKQGRLNILIDGQFGSTGKGLLASFIAMKEGYNIDIAVSTSGPNAGHTFYMAGVKNVVKQLPIIGILNIDSNIYIPPGAVLNPTILLKEIEEYNISANRLFIHPHTTIIAEEDIETEQKGSAVAISSTQNGVGAALSRKIHRSAQVAKDIKELNYFVKPFSLTDDLSFGKTAFVEVPQGYSLSLNSGLYPYCTSREITVQGTLNDCLVHPYHLGKVTMCIRTYPIRVGNLPEGYSGPFFEDSVETTWEALGLETEYTTNTKRVRRVATFSHEQYKQALKGLRPDNVFLNFCNYLTDNQLLGLLQKLPEVNYLGFGPSYLDIFERRKYYA
jgi:adenylosuccinate synthase